MRDALSLLDQVIARRARARSTRRRWSTLFGLVAAASPELNEAILAHDPARALRLADDLAARGAEPGRLRARRRHELPQPAAAAHRPALADGDRPAAGASSVLRGRRRGSREQDLLALIDVAGRTSSASTAARSRASCSRRRSSSTAAFESRVLLADLARRLDGAWPAGAGGGRRARRPAGAGARPAARAAGAARPAAAGGARPRRGARPERRAAGGAACRQRARRPRRRGPTAADRR